MKPTGALTRGQIAWIVLPPLLFVVALVVLAVLLPPGALKDLPSSAELWVKVPVLGVLLVWAVSVARLARRAYAPKA